MLAATDRFILVIDDGPGPVRGVFPEVAAEAGDGRDHDDDAEYAVLGGSAEDGVDNGFADGVVYGRLLVAGGRDWSGQKSVSVARGRRSGDALKNWFSIYT